MNRLLSETWTQLQRSETLLVRTAIAGNLQAYRSALAEISLERTSLQLFTRTSYGLSQDGFSSNDYLVRYPFSSTPAIQAGLEKLVDAGYLIKTDDNRFAPSEAGKQLINQRMNAAGELMNAVDLGATTDDEIQKLLDYDHHILEALKTSERPHGNPILNNRLKGVHPRYEARQRWHHWQLVWTMIAAREDEERFVRQVRQADPLVWFVRRQIWFADRKPWLARALTFEKLLNRAVGYSPIENATEALKQAIQTLKAENWLRNEGDEYRLTENGLSIQDADEAEIIANFLARWPAFTQTELKEMHTIATQLNTYLAELRSQYQNN